jgi:hypothetical protein
MISLVVALSDFPLTLTLSPQGVGAKKGRTFGKRQILEKI